MGEGRSDFQEEIIAALDANVQDAVTDSVEVANVFYVCVAIIAVSGATHNTHVTTIQCSPDDTNWYDTPHTIAGLGFKDNMQITAKHVRAKITTPEGVASVVKVIFQAK